MKFISSHIKLMLNTLRNASVSIVGSGPAGFYMAYFLLKQNKSLHINMFEKLPVPFGLIRFGVAPDHPEVKNVIKTFEQIADHPHFSFYGNVQIGKDIRIQTLLEKSDAVILATGCADSKLLGIEGENLRNVYSATQFVGWYNGLPENVKLLSSMNGISDVAIIGHGNVALDCARILLLPLDKLNETDIVSQAAEVLSSSSIKNVHLIGRRGPLHISFTIKELRELSKLPGVDVIVHDNENCFSVLTESFLADLPRPKRRILELLLQMKSLSDTTSQCKSEKKCHLHFLRSPIRLVAGDKSLSLKSCQLIRNEFTNTEPSKQQMVHQVNNDITTLPCDMLLKSIGYRCTPFESDLVPWDEKGCTIINDNGRVMTPDLLHQPVPKLYCTGWIKRGPNGIIQSCISDALHTSNSIFEDHPHLKLCNEERGVDEEVASASELVGSQLAKTVIDFSGWKSIDAEEKERGRLLGKPREKFTTVGDMIAAASCKS